MIELANDHGFSIMPPKSELSDPKRWVCRGNVIYVPFVEINGIGDSTCEDCVKSTSKARLKGFFGEEVDRQMRSKNTKIDKILDAILAHDNEAIPDKEVLDEYLQFDIGGSVEPDMPYILRHRYRNDNLDNCTDCVLYKEGKGPIQPTMGIYNAIILGEAPGREEDRIGRPFVGPAGDLLWGIFDDYGYSRRTFHVTNSCKCYPRRSKTPTKEHIKTCWQWLGSEIVELESRLILALGNSAMQSLIQKDSGILSKNATTDYVPQLGAWVCWGVHPAYVLRNMNSKPLLVDAVVNFIINFDRMLGKNDIPF